MRQPKRDNENIEDAVVITEGHVTPEALQNLINEFFFSCDQGEVRKHLKDMYLALQDSDYFDLMEKSERASLGFTVDQLCGLTKSLSKFQS